MWCEVGEWGFSSVGREVGAISQAGGGRGFRRRRCGVVASSEAPRRWLRPSLSGESGVRKLGKQCVSASLSHWCHWSKTSERRELFYAGLVMSHSCGLSVPPPTPQVW